MSQIGLPETFRFAIFNTTGVAISNAPVGTPTIGGRFVRFGTDGGLSYSNYISNFLSAFASVGANSYVTGSTISNTASLWVAGEFTASCFVSGSGSGSVVIYLEFSTDGGTTWPSPASAAGPGGGTILAAIAFASTTLVSTASTTRLVNFEL